MDHGFTYLDPGGKLIKKNTTCNGLQMINQSLIIFEIFLHAEDRSRQLSFHRANDFEQLPQVIVGNQERGRAKNLIHHRGIRNKFFDRSTENTGASSATLSLRRIIEPVLHSHPFTTGKFLNALVI